MKSFLKDLGIVIESVIIALVTSVVLYYLLVWILPQKSSFTIEESKRGAFYFMLAWGTLVACIGVYDGFKQESKKSIKSYSEKGKTKV